MCLDTAFFDPRTRISPRSESRGFDLPGFGHADHCRGRFPCSRRPAGRPNALALAAKPHLPPIRPWIPWRHDGSSARGGQGMLHPLVGSPAGRDRPPRPLLRTTLGEVLRRRRLEQGRTLADVARAATSLDAVPLRAGARAQGSFLGGPGRASATPSGRAVRRAGRGRPATWPALRSGPPRSSGSAPDSIAALPRPGLAPATSLPAGRLISPSARPPATRQCLATRQCRASRQAAPAPASCAPSAGAALRVVMTSSARP